MAIVTNTELLIVFRDRSSVLSHTLAWDFLFPYDS